MVNPIQAVDGDAQFASPSLAGGLVEHEEQLEVDVVDAGVTKSHAGTLRALAAIRFAAAWLGVTG